MVGSLLTSVTVTGDCGAKDKLMPRFKDWPRAVFRVAGTSMMPADWTVTLRVASGMFAALAWITADPADPPVTGTFTLVAFAGKFTVAGTEATLGLLDVRLTVRPLDGAGAERFSAIFDDVGPAIVKLGCAKLMVAVTCTGWVPVV